MSATNPESGTISCKYDPNGNLIEKTDARSITTTYSYDYLNRPTNRSYSDSTPTVTYSYDSGSVSFGKGKLASVSTTVSSNVLSLTSYTAYDATGKLLSSEQTTDGLAVCSGTGAACKMSYKYNLAGALTDETYPSGRQVHHNYESDGELAAVSSRATDKRQFKPYAQNFTYNAAGAVTEMQLGNMRWEHTEFNARLQPTKIALGTTAGAEDMLDVVYAYDDGTLLDKNNGNVISQMISVLSVGSTAGFIAIQTYTYDDLNRLKSATENSTPTGGSSAQSWKQTYQFDRFGNRTLDTSSGATTSLPSGFNSNIYNPTINPANNRFNSGQGYAFDAAGNVTEDATGTKFAYDGNNKQRSFGTSGFNDNGGTYVYDGDGHRIKKVIGAEITVFVFNGAGEMVAEYSNSVLSSPQVNYLTVDTLGTPRINTNVSGQVISRHDYMPFGGEISSIGNRSLGTGYVGDSVRQKFTKKERDGETGLDYFSARYYRWEVGRFCSADPGPYDRKDPQVWNRYVYARNTPLKYVDSNGKYFVVAPGFRNIWIKILSTALRTPSGRALIQQIARDSRPTIVATGALPVTLSVSDPTRAHVVVGFTTPLARGPIQNGRPDVSGVTVVMDTNNAAIVANKTGQTPFNMLLTASLHELTHVSDILAAKTLQAAAAANRAGDSPSSSGSGDTMGGTAEKRAENIVAQAGPAGTNFVPNPATDVEAETIIDDGDRQFRADIEKQMKDATDLTLKKNPQQTKSN